MYMALRAGVASRKYAYWDISTAVYSGKSFNAIESTGFTNGMCVGSNGAYIYVCQNSANKVFRYTLSTAFDASTAAYSQTLDISGTVTAIPLDMKFSPDGMNMMILDYARKIWLFTLSTPWSLATASYSGKSFLLNGQVTTDGKAWGICFSADGTKMYVTDFGLQRIWQYTLGTAWDVSTASYSGNYMSTAGQGSSVMKVNLSPDGYRAYTFDGVGTVLYQYALSTPFNISSGSYSGKSFNCSAQVTNPVGFELTDSGRKLFVATSQANRPVFQYTIG